MTRRLIAAGLCCGALALSGFARADHGGTDQLLEGLFTDKPVAKSDTPTRTTPQRSKSAQRSAAPIPEARGTHAARDGRDTDAARSAEIVPTAASQRERAAGPRRVVVSEFAAPKNSRARSAVLTTLSESSDLEVVGYEDVQVTAHRLGVDPASTGGRRKLSAELGIYAWLDGDVGSSQAVVRMSNAQGEPMTTATVQGRSATAIEHVLGERVWESVGALLSERERLRRRFVAEQTLARQKVSTREEELERQRVLATARMRKRQQRLHAEQTLAQQKQSALAAEVTRQRSLVQERMLAVAREAQRQQELQRQQAEAAQRQLLAQQEAERRAAQQREFALRQTTATPTAWRPPTASGTPTYVARTAPTPTYGTQAPTYTGHSGSYADGTAGSEPRPFVPHQFGGSAAALGPRGGEQSPTSAEPSQAFGGEVSPATQRWLQAQRASAE